MSTPYLKHCENYYKTFNCIPPSFIQESDDNQKYIEYKYNQAKLKFKQKLTKKPTKKYIINELTLLIKELSIDNLIYTYDLYDIQTLFSHRNLFQIDEELVISCLQSCGYKLRDNCSVKLI
jgi:hypothetical protein